MLNYGRSEIRPLATLLSTTGSDCADIRKRLLTKSTRWLGNLTYGRNSSNRTLLLVRRTIPILLYFEIYSVLFVHNFSLILFVCLLVYMTVAGAPLDHLAVREDVMSIRKHPELELFIHHKTNVEQYLNNLERGPYVYIWSRLKKGLQSNRST